MWNSLHKGRPSSWWLLLLLTPFAGVLWVPFFNRLGPELWGIPFFLLVLVPLGHCQRADHRLRHGAWLRREPLAAR